MSKIKRTKIKERLNNYPWNYFRLSDVVPLAVMLDNIEHSWCIKTLYKHKDLTWNNIKKILEPRMPQLSYLYSHHKCITWQIIKDNPEHPWHWSVSLNQNITWQIIIDNLEYPWDWDILSYYKPITWDIIKQNIDLFKDKLNWKLLCNNNNVYPNIDEIIDIEIFRKTFDIEIFKNMSYLDCWNWDFMSSIPNLTFDIVLNNIDKDWNWYALSRNPNITFDIVVNNSNLPWKFSSLGLNSNITWEIIFNNIDLAWDWDNLSRYKNITWKDISANYDLFMSKINLSLFVYYKNNFDLEIITNLPELNWNWQRMSSDNIIDYLFKNFPDKPLDYYNLSSNRNITWNIVQDNPDKPWDYNELSRNPNITWDIIQDNPDYFNGSWDFVSYNTNITSQIIQDNLDKPWSYYRLSHNPSITFDIVKNNLDKPWNWDFLSCNENMFDIDTSKEEREYMAVFKIKQYWLRSYYNPEFLICKKRLKREFLNLQIFKFSF
jgi:hypothetical protein